MGSVRLLLTNRRNLNHRCPTSADGCQSFHRIDAAQVSLSHVQPRMTELALQAVERHALPAHVNREARALGRTGRTPIWLRVECMEPTVPRSISPGDLLGAISTRRVNPRVGGQAMPDVRVVR